MALLHYYIMSGINKDALFPFLTLYRSQHLCNPQWPGGVSGDALSWSHLNPAPGLHLWGPVKPAKCQSSLVQFTAAGGSYEHTGRWRQDSVLNNDRCIVSVTCLPFHSWHFQSRCGCTWASPWQPPARPAQCRPSTGTWASSWPAPPAGGGPADPPTRLTG